MITFVRCFDAMIKLVSIVMHFKSMHWMHLVCLYLSFRLIYIVKESIGDVCFITGTVLQINEIRWKGVLGGEFKIIDLPYSSY